MFNHKLYSVLQASSRNSIITAHFEALEGGVRVSAAVEPVVGIMVKKWTSMMIYHVYMWIGRFLNDQQNLNCV